RLDVVVNVVAILIARPFLELRPEEWERTLAVNAGGTVVLAQQAAHQFIRQGGGGRIIAFASIPARTARLNHVAYAPSKAGAAQAGHITGQEIAGDGGQSVVWSAVDAIASGVRPSRRNSLCLSVNGCCSGGQTGSAAHGAGAAGGRRSRGRPPTIVSVFRSSR